MRHNHFLLGASVLCGTASLAPAEIIAVTGAGQHIPAPADARLDRLTSSSFIRVWDELQGFTLLDTLRVDATEPGLYDSEGDLRRREIPAGTPVDSHYVHFDSFCDDYAAAEASITFDGFIVGVIVRGDNKHDLKGRLDRSDYLGAGTIYPDRVEKRGLELSKHEDRFQISDDGRTISFDLRTSSPGDFARIVTMVPEPAPLVLTAISLAVLAPRRRPARRDG